MEPEQQDMEWMEDYLLGRQSPEEAAATLRKIESDEAVKKLHDAMLEVIEVTKYNNRQSHLADLKALEASLPDLTPALTEAAEPAPPAIDPVAVTKPLQWLAIAAAVLLMVGLFWVYNQPSSHEQLATRNFKPYPNIELPAYRNQPTQKELYAQALQHYEAQQYEQSITLLKRLPAADLPPAVHFYLGNAYFANQQFEEAVASFEAFQKQAKAYDLEDLGQWYLALAYLRQGKTDPAKHLLETLSKSDSVHGQQAAELVKQL